MKRRQAGIALILVLWMVSLLAVIAGNFAFGMRSEAQITRNLVSVAQARALADAGVQRAWYELTLPADEAQRWKPDGRVWEMNLADGTVQVIIQDESGKIDINTASETLLKGLFLSVGLDEARSVALLDALVDWRDADTVRRLHGAEESEYRAAGKTVMPTNSPFETIDELRRVLGVTPEIFQLLVPSITVHSRQAGVNTALAPRQVLMAIPGSSAELVDQFLTMREQALASGVTVPPFAPGAAFETGSVGGSAYSVRSIATMRDTSVYVREAVARLTQNPRRPVTVLAWGEGGKPI